MYYKLISAALCRRPRWSLTPIIVVCVIFARLAVVLILDSRPLLEDTELYHGAGVHFISVVHSGQTAPEVLEEWGGGTHYYGLFTAWFYFLFGAHPLFVMLFNSAVAGLGSFMFLGILLDRYPRAHPVLKLLTVLDPTMIFRTSCHTKDPLMFFFFALAASGFSGILRGRRTASLLYLLSIAGIYAIRPHLLPGVIFGGFAGLVVYRRSQPFSDLLARAWHAVLLFAAIVACVALLVVVITVPWETIVTAYSGLLTGLATGGSALSIPELASVADVVGQVSRGIVAVLFRPFPWESGSLSFHVASIYGIVISVVVLLVFREVILRGKHPFRAPFQAFLVVCCASLTIVFAGLAANLGTLARERVQLTAFLWLLLAAVSTSPSPAFIRLDASGMRRQPAPSPAGDSLG